MTSRKRATKKTSAQHAGPTDAAVQRAKAAGIPAYTKDHEIRAARLAHGAQYDRLIANGAIVAPTTAELSNSELDERLAKAQAKRGARGAE